MNVSSRLLRLARPKKFLGAMSLSTGAQLITLSLLVNKLAGLYGILALLTGYSLSPLQLMLYIYSLLALLLSAYLSRHIRLQSPLQCLVLAWFYVLDSIINAVYTVLFAVSWFLVLTQRTGPGADATVDTNDLINPEHKTSGAQITSAPGQDAVATSTPLTTTAVTAAAAAGTSGQASRLQEAVLGTESINSIGIIIALWTVRLYFCIIMLGWARMIIRQHIASSGSKTTTYTTASTSPDLAENPFDSSKPEGQGWPGRIGRFLISIGRSYWLGKDEDDSWMYNMKFKAVTDTGIALNKIEAGPTERERRRRSGTGPPAPAPEVLGDGKKIQRPETVTPTPIPAFAPVERPDEGEAGVGVEEKRCELEEDCGVIEDETDELVAAGEGDDVEMQQLSSDLEHLSTSYQRLRAAQARFRDCIAAVRKVQSTASAPHTPQLIPLTTSLYVPATPSTVSTSTTTTSKEGENGGASKGGVRGTILVDVGTGFYVEKTYAEGVQFYEGKVATLEASLRTVEENVKDKTDTLRGVEDAMRRAVVAQQQHEQQEGKGKGKGSGAG
ncbi:hypothetical protein DV736_g6074, partial [Chaetothyriales sp. CBS 134916]